ncbi:hypothetical protein C2S53_003698 [Perilla frutescens var. hirtella]|uniref:Uncharacterized protein n=1 Tax=Perilla frutescens var. hirtella TaxID=608512 RepID=A0AAD4IPA1_PERFH|nr:hypothetical protein C2S53_003698 [Perilla frutescens var. hirtella]
MVSSNFDGYQYLRMENELFDNKGYTTMHNLIRWKSGKRVDPRLLALLESFGEIYVERREFFKRIFDENYEELFEKIGSAFKKRKQMKKSKSMSRSISMRSIRKRGIDEEFDGPRLERFKVKTPNVIEIEQDGATQGGQTTQTSQGSSNDSK